MEVAVTFPFSKSPVAVQAEQPGRVARISEMPDGRRAVAIALGVGIGEDLVDAGGKKLAQETSRTSSGVGKDSNKPVVLIVDADAAVRDSLKLYLTDEGYDVIAVGNAAEAHVVLTLFTPALVIAEIEGEDLPGYDLCARIKSTARLQTIPVMLMTRSAYPSDYANAHSLGAVVCMAKPFRLERLGHVVRLLAPTPKARQQTAPPRAAGPKRKNGAGNSVKTRFPGKNLGRNGSRSRR
jgi:CheY-like chemotaxis protein